MNKQYAELEKRDRFEANPTVKMQEIIMNCSRKCNGRGHIKLAIKFTQIY